jgi:hypothetical protein
MNLSNRYEDKTTLITRYYNLLYSGAAIPEDDILMRENLLMLIQIREFYNNAIRAAQFIINIL